MTQTLIPHDATSGQIDTLVRERLRSERALYSLDMQVLQSLSPDLIVTQALCDVCAVAESEVQAAACSLPGKPQVINLEPTCLADVFECIRQVGVAYLHDELGQDRHDDAESNGIDEHREQDEDQRIPEGFIAHESFRDGGAPRASLASRR